MTANAPKLPAHRLIGSQFKPWLRRQWCIGQVDGAYLGVMEDVLDVYEQPPQAGRVRLCFDERPCQLLDEICVPLPLTAGQGVRADYEYVRNGTACVLLAYDLDTAQRYVQVRQQRTNADYAAFFDWLLATHYPHATRIDLVQDNLNTHSTRAFYEHLPVARAGELRRTLHFHFTPKHGSWLNMAETEFSALARQCLNRRIAHLDTLAAETVTWAAERNRQGRFTGGSRQARPAPPWLPGTRTSIP